MAKQRTWLWIGLGLAGAAVLVVVAIAVIGVLVVMRNMQVSTASEPSAAAEFAAALARFDDEEPLLQMEDRRHLDVSRLEKRAESYSGPAPTHLRILAWDAREKKLVRLSIPIWLMRFGSKGAYNLDLDGLRLEDVNLTPEQLERAGPALLLDHAERNARVLLWTE
jgi:hypothetical protein